MQWAQTNSKQRKKIQKIHGKMFKATKKNASKNDDI